MNGGGRKGFFLLTGLEVLAEKRQVAVGCGVGGMVATRKKGRQRGNGKSGP